MRKVVNIPKENSFEKNLDLAAEWAKDAGYKESDVDDIVKSYRKSKTHEDIPMSNRR